MDELDDYEARIGRTEIPRSASGVAWAWILLGAAQVLGNLGGCYFAMTLNGALAEMGANQEQVARADASSFSFRVWAFGLMVAGIVGFFGGVSLLRRLERGRRWALVATWLELGLVLLWAYGYSSAALNSPGFGNLFLLLLGLALGVTPLVLMIRVLRDSYLRAALAEDAKRRARLLR